jgi:phosphoribosylamine--glycine ligase
MVQLLRDPTFEPTMQEIGTRMNTLLIGSGGREHALAWKMAQSPLLENLYTSPGNPGTAAHGENVTLDLSEHEALAEFLIDNKIDLIVVGPEAPLVEGFHDRIKEDDNLAHITVIGPQRQGAMLEGSKDFSKAFMAKHEIPTARYKTFDSSSLHKGIEFLESLKAPYVLKCDGLAAGKGVLIEPDLDSAIASLRSILEDGAFGSAGAKVVIEEFLDGVELSVFILTDGKDYLLLPTAKDYKRIGEGDTGLNTGGMGALSPAPVADQAFMQKVKEKVIDRTLTGLQADEIPYQGFIFIGLMRVGDEPYVIEYNVRMGDPETEAVLPRIESDLLAHFVALGKGELKDEKMEVSQRSACTVMMVSGGYPEGYEKGKTITGLDEIDDRSVTFHAGTRREGETILTNGGRVLTITSLHDELEEALKTSYENISKVKFEKAYYRRDIGYELEGA